MDEVMEVMEVESTENKGSEGNKRKNLVSNSPVSSPPPKRVQLLSSIQLDDAAITECNKTDDETPVMIRHRAFYCCETIGVGLSVAMIVSRQQQ